ncbi:phage major capsid protein [Lactiplantibacillus plantarum]|uniref:phage major capsid protein n=1 Tax=Lactiplantibacillus plantarum TaxID=1590 RepID=UPI0026537976|nr:phage major capsid protein [Lactiplantibacillus plantarum]MDN7023152.1 phage major capsid protein [Lactiplantibacillus plantarum]
MIKFDTKAFKNFTDAREKYAQLVKDAAKPEEQQQGFTDMMDALGEDTLSEIKNQVHLQTDDVLNAQRKDPSMTGDEVKFFNALTAGDLSHTEKTEVTLPETTVDQIFEDLVDQHPFLQTIKLQTTGLRLKFLKTDETGGKAVWGKVFDEIKGQLTAKFDDQTATQSKLTAFVALPNDILEFGAAWIKQFVMAQITEAFAAALESAFLVGDGNDKPIGLISDLSKGTVSGDTTTYAQKASVGSITLKDTETAKKELAGIVKKLSVKENGKPYVAKGKTVLVVTPGISLDMEAAMTMQNVNGQWVLAYPFGIQIVESQYVPNGKLIAFVPDRYDAYVAGAVNIKKFTETLAMEDGTLYTAKQFAYGKGKDNNVAFVYDLALETATTTDTAGK